MTKEFLYIGCYTPSGNAGIKVATFDSQSGQLDNIASLSDLPNASFLAVSQDKNYLLAVSESQSDLGCFDIQNPECPVFVNKQSSLGESPCHISLNSKKAFISNYSSGSVSAFSLTDHQLLPAYTYIQHLGSGSNTERQECAHAHASTISIDGQFLVVADLGIDALKVYRINNEQLDLIYTETLSAGAGPRHLAFNERGDRLYLGNELNNKVSVFDFNKQDGSLLLLQTLSSLPEANENTESLIAEVALSKDGYYLYVSNRGHDSIAIFSIDPISGQLKRLDVIKTGGVTPRHFALSPDQRWLLVAHQNSDYLHVFIRDVSTGLLTQTANLLAVKHAVCICFYSN
jgi:6-phosphogluconolactonase